MSKLCSIILAAGEGKRMKSSSPKVLSEVLFKPMLKWVVDSVNDSGIKNVCVVAGYKSEEIENPPVTPQPVLPLYPIPRLPPFHKNAFCENPPIPVHL